MSSRVINGTVEEGEIPLESDEFRPSRKCPEKEMPMLDRIIMGPIKKYQKYENFPWKLLVHIFLLMVCSAQVILVIGSQGAYSRTNQNLFFTLFLNPEMEMEDVDVQRVRYLYNIEDLKEMVTTSFDNYFGIEDSNDVNFENYELVTVPNEQGEQEAQVGFYTNCLCNLKTKISLRD